MQGPKPTAHRIDDAARVAGGVKEESALRPARDFKTLGQAALVGLQQIRRLRRSYMAKPPGRNAARLAGEGRGKGAG